MIETNVSEHGELLTRGIENIYPSREFLAAKLAKGEKVTLYLGIDPTGPTLHLGHALNLRKLAKLQKAGAKIILLIGDFTAMIGDPTDKSAARKRLTHEEVLENAKLYKEQASHFLDFTGTNCAELKYNAAWLSKMSFEDVVNLASHFTVQQILERDMFEKRMKEGKPIHLHEFLYPLMQGYDSVALHVDGELGGNDQTFNMLAGRTLVKQVENREKFVIVMKLLTDSSGKKMGKTEGNMVSLSDSPQEMFGKVMSWSDGMIIPGLELCTDIPLSEIADFQKEIEKGANPKDIKMKLAHEIVSLYHEKEKADDAEKAWGEAFVKGGVPEDIQEAEAGKGEKLSDVLVREKLIASKTEWRRLVEEGAVSIISGEKITDPQFLLESDVSLKIGKHRFLKIKII